MASLKDLISSVTTGQIKASIYNVLTGLGLTPSQWRPGDPEAAINYAASETFGVFWNTWVRPAIRSGWLDYAEGRHLWARAKQNYGVDYIPAQFATGTWTGTCTNPAQLGPHDPGDLVFAHNVTGKVYRNTETVLFTLGVPLDVAIQADEVGTGSDAAPGTIELQAVVIGLTGTNATSVLGVDDEREPDLRSRCRLKLGALSPNGSRSAYEYVALTPTDPRGLWNHGVTITRAKVSANSETAEVSVLLKGPEGAVDPADVAKVDEAIQFHVVPVGNTCTVDSAVGVTIPVTYTVYVPTGLTSGEVQTLVGDALADLFRDIEIGGTVLPSGPTGFVFKNVVEATILKAVPGALQVEVTAPAADVELAANECAVLGTITPTVTFTS